ncbi:MAG: hypothetical protein GTO63_30115 [Anaerolineae bacterium]|nr:hypothetical protein [Anaerolineae bacterium]NIN98961.1 hypothetical protein [Anaerolineae bacterium]
MSRRDLPMAPQDFYAALNLRPELPKNAHDNSMTSCANWCWRLCYQEYILARRPASPGFGLQYGRAWHKMHEVLHKSGSMSAALDVADEIIPEAIDDKYGRSRSRIKEAFIAQINYFESLDKRFEVVCVEQAAEAHCPEGAECVYQWGGCNLQHGGKADRLVRYQNKLWLIDYKTSTRKDPSFADKMVMNPQFLGYAWIYSHLMGEKVWGTIVRRTISNKSNFEPEPYINVISDGQIKQWIRNQQELQVEIKRRFEQHAFDMGGWPTNPEGCWRYGKCEYFSVCTTPDEASRLKQLAAEFVEHRHDYYAL